MTWAKRVLYSEHLAGWAFVAPAVILIGLFGIFPIVWSGVISFQANDLTSPPHGVGFANYKALAKDPAFRTAARHTLIYTVLFVPISIAGAMAIAVALNRRIRGIRFYRLAVFIPVVTSTVATGIVNIWSAAAAPVAQSYHRIEKAYPGRFLLGVGVGHPEHTEEYRKPYDALAEYLDVLDWQWEKKVIPYWTKHAKFAEDHGVKVAIEMHPGFVVYSPETALKLRAIEEAGLKIVERVSIEVDSTEDAAGYLHTKKEKLGHLLTLKRS